jgi:predicted GNAT family N-acyltransferase
MVKLKRKADIMFEISILLDEIKNLLREKNILVNEKIDNSNQDISIELKDKNNNVIGQINGGVGQFKIIENGDESEKEAFSISWVKVEDNYKGYNLGTYLIIYCIYLVKINFSDVEYVVLDDDSDQREQANNIYSKIGFIYQETKQVQNENGRPTTVNTSPEMQLNINYFVNNTMVDKLYKIKSSMQNLVKYEGGKSKINRKTRRNKSKTRSKKGKNGKKSKKRRTTRY